MRTVHQPGAISFEWTRQNNAYYTMCTFRSPKTASQLIEFIHSAHESLLVQGAITALGHMTLPDQFEELTGIADRIAASSGSGYIRYLDLLMRSDLDHAVPFLETLPKPHSLGKPVKSWFCNIAIELSKRPASPWARIRTHGRTGGSDVGDGVSLWLPFTGLLKTISQDRQRISCSAGDFASPRQ